MPERENSSANPPEVKPNFIRNLRDRYLDGTETLSEWNDRLGYKLGRHPEYWLVPTTLVGTGILVYYLTSESVFQQMQEAFSSPRP